jgi:hypothetical protein
MLESTPTLGSVESSDSTKREYAARSLEYNLKSPIFRKLFPKYIERAAAQAMLTSEEASKAERERISASSNPTSAAATSSTAATLKQRRPETNIAPTPIDAPSPAAAAGVGDGGAAILPAPPTLDFLGGRIRIREESIYDVLVMLIVLATIVFAGLYLSTK